MNVGLKYNFGGSIEEYFRSFESVQEKEGRKKISLEDGIINRRREKMFGQKTFFRQVYELRKVIAT